MSLREFLDPNSIANEIRLERQVRKVAVLVVEGIDDKKILAKFVDMVRCSIVPAYGKENVLQIIALLERDGFQGMLGVADTDFDKIENATHSSLNMVFTDEHDAECMMLRSTAFPRLLIEIADETRLRRYEARSGGIQEILLDRAKTVGCARLVSLRRGLNLDFDGLQFRFVDRGSLVLDIDRFVDQIVSRTANCAITRVELGQLVRAEVKQNHDEWQICCGDDIVAILAIAIRRCIGRATAAEADATVIASKLRLTYSVEEFQSTSMFMEISRWEARQPQFAFTRERRPNPLMLHEHPHG